MSDVIIAPAALFGKGDRSRTDHPINDDPNLPLGDKTAVTKDTHDDRYLTTELKTPTIADAVVRNNSTYEQKFTLVNLSLVGKKSSEGPKHTFDQSVITNFNKKNSDRTTKKVADDALTENFNMVATPFVQAKSIFPEIYNI